MRTLPGAGQSILVQVVPVDPRDLLSGQYINLNYKFTRVSPLTPPGATLTPGDTIYVVLMPEGKFYVPRSAAVTRPTDVKAGDVVIKGVIGDWSRAGFGIERYYVPEKTETPSQRDITVLLRVGDDHEPRIEKVFVKDKPWP